MNINNSGPNGINPTKPGVSNGLNPEWRKISRRFSGMLALPTPVEEEADSK
jgi:hypothetical protein